ncbi:MAG: tetratricopeptide repeat protein [Candidatus Hydrogenedens sp.]|nr:tetratricopeptide repeat protein [Candidatus Hydrogenedens sp.]
MPTSIEQDATPPDSTDIWELARYVEEHPMDHERRWQLAKKMYMAWEYRHALEHLQVLHNEWDERQNVVRYLAATYYRLGRYAESIKELESAIARWPQEIGLREQLARVLEVAGKRQEASSVWGEVANIQPDHPTANSAIRRLQSKPERTPQEDLGLTDSDSGIDLTVGVVCRECGAQNSAEEQRCWQCNAPISQQSSTIRRRPKQQEAPVSSGPSIETLVTLTGIAGVIIAGVCVYLSVMLMLKDRTAFGSYGFRTVWDLYEYGLGRTRLALGAGLYLGWPLALWAGMRFTRSPLKVPPAFITLSGLALAGLSFLCTWLPPNSLPLAFFLPLALSAVIVIAALGLTARQAFGVWAIQAMLVTALVPAVLAGAERLQLGTFYNPLVEIPRVIQYVQGRSPILDTGIYQIPGNTLPIKQQVTWNSTGSDWLDARGGRTFFKIVSNSPPPQMRFEIKDESGTRLYENVRGDDWTTEFPIEPGKRYEILVYGAENFPVSLECAGLMRPDFVK